MDSTYQPSVSSTLEHQSRPEIPQEIEKEGWRASTSTNPYWYKILFVKMISKETMWVSSSCIVCGENRDLLCLFCVAERRCVCGVE